MQKKTDIRTLRDKCKTSFKAKAGKRLGASVKAQQKMEVGGKRVTTIRQVLGG